MARKAQNDRKPRTSNLLPRPSRPYIPDVILNNPNWQTVYDIRTTWTYYIPQQKLVTYFGYKLSRLRLTMLVQRKGLASITVRKIYPMMVQRKFCLHFLGKNSTEGQYIRRLYDDGFILRHRRRRTKPIEFQLKYGRKCHWCRRRIRGGKGKNKVGHWGRIFFLCACIKLSWIDFLVFKTNSTVFFSLCTYVQQHLGVHKCT